MIKFPRSFSETELHYMSPKTAAVRRQSKTFSLITLGIICVFVVLFFLWAGFSEIDVVTKATGHIIPSQKTQVISHLEGGIISEVLVKEGDLVEAGQVLMRIDPTIPGTRYTSHHQQYLHYLAAAERLQAQLNEEDYEVPEIVKIQAPDIAMEEMASFQEWKDHFESKKAVAHEIVIQKEQEIEEAKAKIAQAQDQLGLSNQELTMVAPLVKEQLISKREILRLKRDAANLKGEIAIGKAALLKAQATLKQAQYELEQIPLRTQNENQEQLRDILIKLSETKAAMLESKDRMIRTELRSPIKGAVKEIKMKTLKGVIQPGQEVINIVPYEDTLLVETDVLPADIAFLHPGQEAIIKITAYDYSIYGPLKGKLLNISADTIHDPEQKKNFYRVILISNKNYLEHKGKKLELLPGMAIEADILTGKRTVLQYLLKPLIKGLKESFTER